jgi:hypothetical protein
MAGARRGERFHSASFFLSFSGISSSSPQRYFGSSDLSVSPTPFFFHRREKWSSLSLSLSLRLFLSGCSFESETPSPPPVMSLAVGRHPPLFHSSSPLILQESAELFHSSFSKTFFFIFFFSFSIFTICSSLGGEDIRFFFFGGSCFCCCFFDQMAVR